MNQAYDNTNSGALFKNEKKISENQPDYTGTYTDGAGSEFWLSAWIKTSAAGKKYMSLATTAKEQQAQAQAQAANVEVTPASAQVTDVDSIPF